MQTGGAVETGHRLNDFRKPVYGNPLRAPLAAIGDPLDAAGAGAAAPNEAVVVGLDLVEQEIRRHGYPPYGS